MELFNIPNEFISFNTLPTLLRVGIILVLLITIFSTIFFLKKPRAIKNGQEFADEYNKIAKTEIKPAVSRLVWFIPTHALSKKNEQILPYTLMEFRRFLFLIETIFWVEFARLRIEKKIFTLYAINISKWLIILATFAGVDVLIAWRTGIGPFQNIDFIRMALRFIYSSFAVSLIPTIFLIKRSFKVIDKMELDEEDRSELKSRIKLFWLLPLALTLFEIIRLISQFLHFFTKKSKTRNT